MVSRKNLLVVVWLINYRKESRIDRKTQKVVIDKVPLYIIHHTVIVAPNRFVNQAKVCSFSKLQMKSRSIKCLHSMLVSLKERRYKKNFVNMNNKMAK